MRRVAKIIIQYDDGTFEELVGSATAQPQQIMPVYPNGIPPCLVCGGYHGGLACPNMIVTCESKSE